MAFKRATWHSGLTYSQTCERCRTKVTYMDNILDFRPWYPDGFVYCPTCNTPLRHNENYAINRPAQQVSVDMTAAAPAAEVTPTQIGGTAAFCTGCGRAFAAGENFCPNCGTKRQ